MENNDEDPMFPPLHNDPAGSLSVDCSGIVDQVLSIVSEQNELELGKIDATLNTQKEQLDKVVSNMNNFFQQASRHVSDSNVQEGNRSEQLNHTSPRSPNAPDGALASEKSTAVWSPFLLGPPLLIVCL